MDKGQEVGGGGCGGVVGLTVKRSLGEKVLEVYSERNLVRIKPSSFSVGHT